MDIAFLFNRKMIFLTEVTVLSVTKTLICLQGLAKEIFITSHVLSFYIQLFHYGKDSKHTALYATASGALVNSPYQFALISATARRIGNLAAQHFCTLKSLSQ